MALLKDMHSFSGTLDLKSLHHLQAPRLWPQIFFCLYLQSAGLHVFILNTCAVPGTVLSARDLKETK